MLIPAGAMSVAVATALIVFSGLGSSGSGSTAPAFAAAAVRVAESNSRLLVSEPGWRVTRADDFKPDSGEIEFSDGDHQLQITWYPARSFESYRRDRAAEPGPDVPVEVLGQTGTMIRYGKSTDYATMLPPQGPTFIEIRGDLGGEAPYLEILGSLRHVDVETWLAAMPPSVVQPTDRGEVVDSMLNGVPVPTGLNLDELRAGDGVSDRYQLGAKVTGAVSCEWLDHRAAARKAGDAETARESVEAMSTSRSWPILREMQSQGGWSQVLWSISRQLQRGDLDRLLGSAGTDTLPGGKTYEFGPRYATALGCDSEYRRLRTGG